MYVHVHVCGTCTCTTYMYMYLYKVLKFEWYTYFVNPCFVAIYMQNYEYVYLLKYLICTKPKFLADE